MGDHSQDLTDEKKKKPLSLGTPVANRKAAGANQVRQSFSHGRSKSVTVEVKKRRGAQQPLRETPAAEVAQQEKEPPAATGRLTHEEQDTRLRALQDAMQQAATEEAGLEKKQPITSEESTVQEAGEISETSPPEEPAVDSTPAPQEDQGEFVLAPLQPDPTLGIKVIERKKSPSKPVATQKEWDLKVGEDEEEIPQKRKSSRFDGKNLGTDAHKADSKRNFRQTAWRSDENEDFVSSRRTPGRRKRKQSTGSQTPAPKLTRDVLVPDFISVQELANRMSEKVSTVIKTLMGMGVMATQNQSIDGETAELTATELGHLVTRISDTDVERDLILEDNPDTVFQPKAPVVTVMGHVDHGKTSLLDALRKTNQVASEAGGITQHIGAYQVALPSGKSITFIDTPGHAAFTEMRSRGAHVTDIVVLVVAADDSVKDQTIEAIHHAKAANVPIVVAINKIDKPDANPDRVRQMLLSHEVILENLGGDVLDVEVSAKTGFNLDKLEEAILLQAEILDLKANANRLAEGVVIEAKVEKGRGSVATVLVQKGTLRVGDAFVAGQEWGRVRALMNYQGQAISSATPSVPVEISGFSAPPSAGDLFVVVADEARARKVAEFRKEQAHQKKVAVAVPSQSWEELLVEKASGNDQQIGELAIVLKVDTQGSLEALRKSLDNITHDEVRIRLLHGAVGAITESDVVLAKASSAMIIGFNVRANPQASNVAKKEGIDIRYYSVIYTVLDDVKAALSGLLSPTLHENFLGNATIRQVFNITKVGKIAGCMVTEGVVKRGAKVRLLRDHVVIHEGSLKTLKRVKDEVREAREGYECGMAFENYQDIREGDIIECFEIEEVQRTL